MYVIYFLSCQCVLKASEKLSSQTKALQTQGAFYLTCCSSGVMSTGYMFLFLCLVFPFISPALFLSLSLSFPLPQYHSRVHIKCVWAAANQKTAALGTFVPHTCSAPPSHRPINTSVICDRLIQPLRGLVCCCFCDVETRLIISHALIV